MSLDPDDEFKRVDALNPPGACYRQDVVQQGTSHALVQMGAVGAAWT